MKKIELNQLRNLVAEVSRSTPRKRKRQTKRRDRSVTFSKVAAPSSGGVVMSRGRNTPRIISKGASTVVCNTELVSGVQTLAAGLFTNAQAAMLPFNFGWISGVAANFSKWRWLHVRFFYIPACPTTTTGSVTLGLNYDFNDIAPSSSQIAQEQFNSVTAPVWAGYEGSNLMNSYTKAKTAGCVVVDVDVDRLGGPSGPAYYRYISSAAFTALTQVDKNIYGPGGLNISTFGGVAATVGNVFVEYCIELIEPISAAQNV